MPRLLELCSGTGSVGQAFSARGWDVVSLDINPKARPTICCDLLELTVEQCTEQGPVDFVWASPPCTFYSIARATGPPADLKAADMLVQKCLDLAAELGAPFIMENPYTGKLKSRAVVAGIPMRVVDYCKYGTPYRKRTSLWTNTAFEPSQPLCAYDCGSCVGRKHVEHAQRGSWAGSGEGRRSQSLNTLYALPAALCDEIAAFASQGRGSGEGERSANPKQWVARVPEIVGNQSLPVGCVPSGGLFFAQWSSSSGSSAR
jgi:hypothetical protein